MSGVRAGTAIVVAHALTTAVIVLSHDATSPWRYAYLGPVVAAGLGFGLSGGLVSSLVAAFCYAPVVLPEIERTGLTPAALEALLTFGVLAAAGALTGALAATARRHRTRYATLLAVQRALAVEAPLDRALARLRAALAVRLAPAEVALVARDDDRLVVAGGDVLAPDSPMAGVLATGEPVFLRDVAPEARPRRLFVVPLAAGARTTGALAVESEAEITADDRAALLALGAHVGLALDNARLASRQRRFTAELEERVAEATRMKSDFVAIASHELRTPLTAIQGFSELLATRSFPAVESRRIAGVIRGESERLGRIVSDFLDLSRLERGLAPSLRRARVDVAATMAAALDVFRWSSLAQRIELDCPAGLPAVDADADALDRIVKNLVSNALKYSPATSLVRVAALPTTDGVEISVHDAGGGIPPAELARIFEPYYRAPGTAASARGSGIGLAVVKSLVEAHGGVIRAESAPAHGTRMAFVLPAVP